MRGIGDILFLVQIPLMLSVGIEMMVSYVHDISLLHWSGFPVHPFVYICTFVCPSTVLVNICAKVFA